MAKFHYEWWTVAITFPSGKVMCEYKGKSREDVVRQIEKEIRDSNSDENLRKPWWERKQPVLSVDWESLTLDRVGYQRLS